MHFCQNVLEYICRRFDNIHIYMYSYSLPNGIVIQHEHIVDAVLSPEEYPQTYLDTHTGALIEVPSKQSLAIWVNETKNTKRFLLIERLSDADRVACARDFISSILTHELSAKKVSEAGALLSNGGMEAFEDFLMEETDGWFIGWESYQGEMAYDHVCEWLLQNPTVKITEQFTGCGECAICTMMREESTPDMGKLMSAFETEQFMDTFTKNFSKQYPQHASPTTETGKSEKQQSTTVQKNTKNKK